MSPWMFSTEVRLRNQSFECQKLLHVLRDLQVSDDIWSIHRGASAADSSLMAYWNIGKRMTRSHTQRSQFT